MDDRLPDVSVVMGVYNAADTLAAAMDSILTQEGVSLEFIVVNDGSTDGTGALLDAYARRDPRVRVVSQENQGLTRSLIRGCALARAPWIARQDADDRSLPGRLRAQWHRAVLPDAPVLIGCGARVVSAAGEELLETVPPAEPDQARRWVLEDGRAISPHGSIFFSRKAYEAAGGYRPEFLYGQDIDLNIRLAEQGPVAAVPGVYFEYCYSISNISGRHAARQRAFYDLCREGYALRRQGKSDAEILQRVAALRSECIRNPSGSSSFDAYYFMGACLLQRAPDRAAGYLLAAWKQRPWSLKALFRWCQARRRCSGGRLS